MAINTADLEPVVQGLVREQHRAGLTVRGLARELDITPSALSRILRGERRPGRDVLDRILGRYPQLAYEYVQSTSLSEGRPA